MDVAGSRDSNVEGTKCVRYNFSMTDKVIS